MSKPIRYHFKTCATREIAEATIEGMFAIGQVSESEDPRIERKRGRNGGTVYCITLIDLSLSAYA